MPKTIIDYFNTIIYKIYCNDLSIKDIYIGHTTNFVKRKYQHKICTNSGKKLKIYDMIRQNGGWDNWNMVEIAKYNCKDSTESRIREQEHYDLLKPTLNILNPISNNPYHVMYSDNLSKNNVYKHSCDYCGIKTNNKKDYNNHLLTTKHVKLTNVNEMVTSCSSIPQNCHINNKTFICEICEKVYKSRVGLWKHKKKCFYEDKKEIHTSISSDKDLIMMLVKQNIELMDILKNGINNTNKNINTTA